MSGTQKSAGLTARVLTAASVTAAYVLSVFILPHAAIAQNALLPDHNLTSDIFSEVLSDLQKMKEVAFTKPFLSCDQSNDCKLNHCGNASKSVQCQHCDLTEKVCTHLAHPEIPIGVSDDCETNHPLACSYDVRSTDAIPPVPNIEDYATPDEFVDEDMINKLQSDEVTMEKGIENYCDQMATLLSDALASNDLSHTQKAAAIKSAMQLAVVNAQIAAEAKIVQIKSAHESELAVMRGRLLQYSYIESNQRKLFQWLNPIYNNVNRNFQQIEKMTESSTELKHCLSIIQTQINENHATDEKNQLIVTRRDQPKPLPIPPRSTVRKVSNQFVRKTVAAEEDRITPVDFKILELRLRKAERLIADLSAGADSAESYDAPTHRRASYDRLTPIAPLPPRR